MRVLITGGAGFIGTSLSRRLLTLGNTITVLDNFHPQIHGNHNLLPQDLADAVELVVGDVRDRDVFMRVLQDKDVVVHLAAETGTGQSMYEVLRYEDVNVKGMATLLDVVTKDRPPALRKIVLSSSRAVYGEGKYRCPEHAMVYPGMRRVVDMKRGQFQPRCPVCQESCTAVPTDEQSALAPTSFYGLTKQVQEQMLLMQASVMGISACVLRYQNVYGPGQSLKNPYTGILAIFFNLARAGKPINIFEDGEESRDFIFVEDVVDATILAMNSNSSDQSIFNVGTGMAVSVRSVAEQIVQWTNSESRIRITGEFRIGDIRHNFADLCRIRENLNFNPEWNFTSGLHEFLTWASLSDKGDIGYEASIKAMREAGLHHGSGEERGTEKS